MASIAELTRTLVAIPSHADETAAGDAIERWLTRETDATVRRDAVGNVIATRGSGEVTLALVGHHDVVPPDAEQLDGEEYVVRERSGRLYARGAADMKGAVAAAMLAFRDADPEVRIAFASFVGEETGGVGVRHALTEGFGTDYAVVGEGSTNYSGNGVTDVVIAHRGRRETEIVATGRSSHAGEPEAGDNAIYRACDAMDEIRSRESPSTTIRGHPFSGSWTVTQIQGGETTNVIPDRCSFTVDERTVPGARFSLDRFESIPGIEWSVQQDLPPMACSDDRFADEVLAVADSKQPASPELVTKPHATDAGWLAQEGIACVVCGPAEPGEAHTATESVSLEVLERCYRIYRAAAELDFEWVTADH